MQIGQIRRNKSVYASCSAGDAGNVQLFFWRCKSGCSANPSHWQIQSRSSDANSSDKTMEMQIPLLRCQTNKWMSVLVQCFQRTKEHGGSPLQCFMSEKLITVNERIIPGSIRFNNFHSLFYFRLYNLTIHQKIIENIFAKREFLQHNSVIPKIWQKLFLPNAPLFIEP